MGNRFAKNKLVIKKRPGSSPLPGRFVYKDCNNGFAAVAVFAWSVGCV
jgi:hypothetical protein